MLCLKLHTALRNMCCFTVAIELILGIYSDGFLQSNCLILVVKEMGLLSFRGWILPGWWTNVEGMMSGSVSCR